jgi:hypothetical protein
VVADLGNQDYIGLIKQMQTLLVQEVDCMI